MTNAATLQKALDNLELEKFRSLDGGSSSYLSTTYLGTDTSGYSSISSQSSVTPNCDNYEIVYQYEYEELLQLSSRNYQITSIPPDYQECAIHTNPYSPGELYFDSLSGIINDCLYTEGIHAMGRSKSGSDARSTAMIGKSDDYQKFCSKFKCESGIPSYDYNKASPESFRKHQCSSNFNGQQIVERLKQNYLRDGKICGSSLSDILTSNKKF